MRPQSESTEELPRRLEIGRDPKGIERDLEGKNLDIQYLLWLQDFRNNIGDAWTPFMEWVSMFATNYVILIPIFLYWYWDKRKGLYALVSYYFCMVVTPIAKLTVCTYRPWIRDSRVIPAGNSIATATGYSFPSGHTSTCGPLAGGVAVNLWEDKRTRWLSVILVAFVLLTGFSRNYLGVHTPQDVFVGIALSILSLIVTAKLFCYLDAHPEKEDGILLGSFLFCCAALAYITLKRYPMDMNSEGKLIVDPQKMMNDGYGDLGKAMGFIIGRYIEKKWIRFQPSRRGWPTAVLCLLGLIPVVMLKSALRPVMTQAFGAHWGKLAFSVIHALYYIALVPLVLKLIGIWTAKQEEAA